MAIPVDHPQRFALNYELHARPPEALDIPEQASYLALATDPSNREAEYQRIVELCTRYGVPAPAADLNHFQVDLGLFRLKWKRRTECNSYTFFRQGGFDDPFAEPVIASVPQDWLESLPGFAAWCNVLRCRCQVISPMPPRPLRRWIAAHSLVTMPVVSP